MGSHSSHTGDYPGGQEIANHKDMGLGCLPKSWIQDKKFPK